MVKDIDAFDTARTIEALANAGSHRAERVAFLADSLLALVLVR